MQRRIDALTFDFIYVYLFALHFCMKYYMKRQKKISLFSTLYLLRQSKKCQSYIVIPFSFFMYIHHPARKFGLSCLTPLSVPQYPFIFFLALSTFFICAPRSQFRRNTLLDGETRQDGRASPKNPISVTSELKAKDRYHEITCVTAECYSRKTTLGFRAGMVIFRDRRRRALCLPNSLF